MPMNKSLDSAKTKFQWAEKHFSDFKDIVFGRSDGIDRRPTTVTHYDVPRQTHLGASQFALNRESPRSRTSDIQTRQNDQDTTSRWHC